MSNDPRNTSPSVPDDDGVVTGPAVHVDRAHPESDASLSDLLSRFVDDITLLFRQELELAKSEMRRDLSRAGKAGGMLVAGGVLAFVALLLLAWAAAWGLAAVVPTGWAFLIVGLIVAAAAAAVMMTGRKRLQALDLAPEASIDSLKKDKETLSERKPR